MQLLRASIISKRKALFELLGRVQRREEKRDSLWLETIMYIVVVRIGFSRRFNTRLLYSMLQTKLRMEGKELRNRCCSMLLYSFEHKRRKNLRLGDGFNTS